jgi:cytidine deaminase
MDAELDPEDAKIITLARSARARSGARTGAAVRDSTGRTYAAVEVELPSLRLSALEVAVAMAVSSGAAALEAAAIVSAAAEAGAAELAPAWDLKAGHVLLAAPDGSLAALYPGATRSA